MQCNNLWDINLDPNRSPFPNLCDENTQINQANHHFHKGARQKAKKGAYCRFECSVLLFGIINQLTDKGAQKWTYDYTKGHWRKQAKDQADVRSPYAIACSSKFFCAIARHPIIQHAHQGHKKKTYGKQNPLKRYLAAKMQHQNTQPTEGRPG